MKTEKYPFDYDALNKGDSISPEVVESIVRLPRTSKKYSLKAAGLAKQLEKELGARGKKCVVCIRNDALCILADDEADDYTRQQSAIARRKERRNFTRALQIDTRNLSEERRVALERRLLVEGTMISAANKARRRLRIEAHARAVPALPEK